MRLGSADAMPLVEARSAANEARLMLTRGIDPLEARHAGVEVAREAERARRQAKVVSQTTLARVARAYHERISAKFRNPKHQAQWISSLEQHVPTDIWHKPIAAIKPAELIDFLVKLEREVPETGRRVRQRLGKAFDDAVVRDQLDRSPMPKVVVAVGELVGPQKKGQFRSLPYPEIPAFARELKARAGTSARALEFLLLTASRTGEVLGARWEEFDLEAGLWTVPGERMKGGEPHTVFLSPRALEIVRAQPVLEESAHVFPSLADGRGPLSNMAGLQLLKRMDYDDRTTVHGLRASFSTWANEATQFKPDVIEACLAHKEGDRVRAAYNRAQFTEDRKALLAAWARFAEGHDNVTALRSAA